MEIRWTAVIEKKIVQIRSSGRNVVTLVDKRD